MFSALPNALQLLVSPLLLLLGSEPDNYLPQTSLPPSLPFSLRHEHAISNDSRVLFSDVPPSLLADPITLRTRRIKSHKPSSHEAFMEARMNMWLNQQSQADLWIESEVNAPDVHNRATLLALAQMTNNAYYNTSDKGWYTLGPFWGNNSSPIGWEPDADGFRGHIFVSEDNSTVVLSIKGTSLSWIVGDGGPTVKKDKYNDNLLFSCCCARVGPTWSTVCDCYSGSYKCDNTCLQTALIEDSLFYNIATSLYNNVTYMYPTADIWIVGHSLGGALASLLGATFGVPAVSIEAPGEKLASQRLHLPSPPSLHNIVSVYHTADPIAMGVCTGVSSVCALGGYALETGCHLGKIIRYDTVSKLNWSVDIRSHSIRRVIESVLSEDWEIASEGKPGREVPPFTDEDGCIDCFNWEFGDFKKGHA